MIDFQFDDGRVNIGIDVGWSEKKKSCAVATEGIIIPEGTLGWKVYIGGERPIAVGIFRYSELLDTVANLFHSLGSRRDRTAVVIDGPIGAKGLARKNRHVDVAFCRGEFNRRVQPMPVETGDGPKYARVTDKLVSALYQAAGLPYRPAWWDGGRIGSFMCCETHPTVGLALLLPPQDRETLPTRTSPRRFVGGVPAINKDEARWIRAKSDWYWQLGAGRWVAEEVLKCPAVAQEADHERVAGLYCLAVANRLSCHDPDNSPTAAAVGDSDGVYVIPSVVDSQWERVLTETVGIHAGQLIPRDQSHYVVSVDNARGGHLYESHTTAPESQIDSDDAEKGDSATLILTDNGGIWERHNDWLFGLDPPVCIRTEDDFNEIIQLKATARRGQWSSTETISGSQRSKNSPLTLARRRGFQDDHLSKGTACAIPVTLVDCK